MKIITNLTANNKRKGPPMTLALMEARVKISWTVYVNISWTVYVTISWTVYVNISWTVYVNISWTVYVNISWTVYVNISWTVYVNISCEWLFVNVKWPLWSRVDEKKKQPYSGRSARCRYRSLVASPNWQCHRVGITDPTTYWPLMFTFTYSDAAINNLLQRLRHRIVKFSGWNLSNTTTNTQGGIQVLLPHIFQVASLQTMYSFMAILTQHNKGWQTVSRIQTWHLTFWPITVFPLPKQSVK